MTTNVYELLVKAASEQFPGNEAEFMAGFMEKISAPLTNGGYGSVQPAGPRPPQFGNITPDAEKAYQRENQDLDLKNRIAVEEFKHDKTSLRDIAKDARDEARRLRDYAYAGAAGLIGAAVVKGVSSASDFASNSALKSKFNTAFEQVSSTNRVVKGADKTKARAYAETIFKFAPHVAADPNLLSSVLANAVLGEGIDQMTIKSLTDLEGRYITNNETKPFAGIRV